MRITRNIFRTTVFSKIRFFFIQDSLRQFFVYHATDGKHGMGAGKAQGLVVIVAGADVTVVSANNATHDV
jgi:hypothetical protein